MFIIEDGDLVRWPHRFDDVWELGGSVDGRNLWVETLYAVGTVKFMDVKPDYWAIGIIFAGRRKSEVHPTWNCMHINGIH